MNEHDKARYNVYFEQKVAFVVNNTYKSINIFIFHLRFVSIHSKWVYLSPLLLLLLLFWFFICYQVTHFNCEELLKDFLLFDLFPSNQSENGHIFCRCQYLFEVRTELYTFVSFFT